MEKSGGALEAFVRYTEDFGRLDPKAAARHFHEPALSITPPHGVVAMPTREAVEQMYARVMADLPAQGYARTELSALSERRLGEDLAVVTGSGVWKSRTGEDLQRFGMTYTFHRSAGTWQIAVMAVHAPL